MMILVWSGYTVYLVSHRTTPRRKLREQYFTSHACRANWGKGVTRIAYVQIDPRSGRGAELDQSRSQATTVAGRRAAPMNS
jgi:hypothetical protein